MTDTDDSGVAGLKAGLRAEARAARLRLQDRAAAAQALPRRFDDGPWGNARPGTVIGGYWPVNGEIDCRPLLDHLRKAGAVIALPVVEKLAAPLSFRLWNGEPPACVDLVKMRVPDPEAGTAVPEVMLVPLLLVDRSGHRLGYGGGYYDRTLNALRQARSVTALGLAFDAQLTDKLPSGADDMTLDGLVTEKGWMVFGGRGATD